MPLSVGIGVLDFAALMLLALAVKREGRLTMSAALGLCAYGALAWGIIGWLWPLIVQA